MADINAGIPTIYRKNIEKFIPQMVNLDLINGISFSKGCYTGQEIVARVQHRGNIKKRMFHITTGIPDKALNPGATIFHKDSGVGTIVQSLKNNDQMNSLAVIGNDASTEDLSVEGMKIKIK